jgi:hypothetical protein
MLRKLPTYGDHFSYSPRVLQVNRCIFLFQRRSRKHTVEDLVKTADQNGFVPGADEEEGLARKTRDD